MSSTTTTNVSAPTVVTPVHAVSAEAAKYKTLTHREFCLQRPTVYLGDMNQSEQAVMVLDESGKYTEKLLTFSPGLIKCFDEVLINARDAAVKSQEVTFIKVTIDPIQPIITIHNNGPSIPVEKNLDGVWVPEMIFGRMLSGSNFDDSEERTTGGTNGCGVKLTNTFSTEFQLHTANYKQVFKNNLSVIEPAQIGGKKMPGVEVKFTLDLARFDNTTLEEYRSVVVKVLEARVYDLCPCLREDIKLHLNGNMLKQAKSLSAYVQMYPADVKPIIDEGSAEWRVAVLPSADGFKSFGFCNGIVTNTGSAVNHVVNQIVDGVASCKKFAGKDGVKKKIKDHLQVFVVCTIVNPTWKTQNKDELTTKVGQFKWRFKVGEETIKKVTRAVSEMVEADLAKSDEKQVAKSDGNGQKVNIRVPKLRDADAAGTKDSHKCTLILTEGDSALSLILAGVSVIGFKHTGAFPLKGKLINPQTNSATTLAANSELCNLKRIVGLQSGEEYTVTNIKTRLRYNRIMCAVDADDDGMHIMGLVANLFNTLWPSLLKIPGFLMLFRTPAIIATPTRGVKTPIEFYSGPQYEAWAANHNTDTYKVKHLKGLGTSTSAQGKDYFRNLARNTVTFATDSEELDLFFNGKRADDRKVWLAENNRPTDTDSTSITFKDFKNRGLFDFSIDANSRSIPDLRDGLKPSLRKIIGTLFDKYGEKSVTNEIKIMQLGSSVAEFQNYSHGEVSLVEAIFGMCQDYYSAGNNINLLDGVGQVGDALANGKNHASARYVFAKQSKLARLVFKAVDDHILPNKIEEGATVEKFAYMGVVPMCLINAPIGIGLGYSTQIPPHNPLDVITNLKNKLKGQEFSHMMPHYRGFNGTVTKKNDTAYEIHGVHRLNGKQLVISELPVGVAFNDYTETLEKLIDQGVVRSYNNGCTTEHAAYTINLVTEMAPAQVEKQFKLSTSVSTTNMVLFIGDRIKRYESVTEIMQVFYEHSMVRYTKRKAYIISSLTEQMRKLDLERQLIQLVVTDMVVVFRRKKDNVTEQLAPYSLSEHTGLLLGFSMGRFTLEEIDKLGNKITDLEAELATINGKTEAQLWRADLDELERELVKQAKV